MFFSNIPVQHTHVVILYAYSYLSSLLKILIEIIGWTVIAVDAKEHMHRRQLLAGMIMSNTRSVAVHRICILCLHVILTLLDMNVK